METTIRQLKQRAEVCRKDAQDRRQAASVLEIRSAVYDEAAELLTAEMNVSLRSGSQDACAPSEKPMIARR
jgi:hypothetical protein